MTKTRQLEAMLRAVRLDGTLDTIWTRLPQAAAVRSRPYRAPPTAL